MKTPILVIVSFTLFILSACDPCRNENCESIGELPLYLDIRDVSGNSLLDIPGQAYSRESISIEYDLGNIRIDAGQSGCFSDTQALTCIVPEVIGVILRYGNGEQDHISITEKEINVDECCGTSFRGYSITTDRGDIMCQPCSPRQVAVLIK